MSACMDTLLADQRRLDAKRDRDREADAALLGTACDAIAANVYRRTAQDAWDDISRTPAELAANAFLGAVVDGKPQATLPHSTDQGTYMTTIQAALPQDGDAEAARLLLAACSRAMRALGRNDPRENAEIVTVLRAFVHRSAKSYAGDCAECWE